MQEGVFGGCWEAAVGAAWCEWCAVLEFCCGVLVLVCVDAGVLVGVDLGLGGGVQRCPGPPSSLEFHRDYVSKNRPVIFTGEG